MKARIKKTGVIWEFNKVDETIYESDIYGHLYRAEELEPLEPSPHTPDYWTRLEHTYAGMALQGLIVTTLKRNVTYQVVAQWAKDYAHALVEKLKEEEQ